MLEKIQKQDFKGLNELFIAKIVDPNMAINDL